MQAYLEEAVYDIDDSHGQRLVLTLVWPTNNSERLFDLRPIQSLIGRTVDVQIVDVKALPAPEKVRN